MRSSLRRRQQAAAAAAALAGIAASLTPGAHALALDSNTDSVTVDVTVGAGITIDVTTVSFSMTGMPGQTVPHPAAVALRVFTNNAAGYIVTVEPAAPDLAGTGGVTDAIPMTDLAVRNTAVGGAFVNLTPG